MKISHMLSALLISMTALGCNQKHSCIKPLFMQQREIKGITAYHQLMASCVLHYGMKDEVFRSYAQQSIKEQVQKGVNYLLSNRRTPECLSDEGEIASRHIITEGNIGPCSLYFYNGKFNVGRNGRIKRIPQCDTDEILQQLDDKSIYNYLSIANIHMKRCSDDSILLRAHIGGKGGAWQVAAFEWGMWILFQGGRLLTQFAIGQGVRGIATTTQREAPRVAQAVTNGVSRSMTGDRWTDAIYEGEIVYNVPRSAGPGSFYYYKAVMRDGVQYLVKEGARTIAQTITDVVRSTAQNPVVQSSAVAATSGYIYDYVTEGAGGAVSTAVAGVMDVASNFYPETAQEMATGWFLSLSGGLLELTRTWRF